MAIPASLGIGSGLNLGALLDQLGQAEQQRLVPLKGQKASYQVKLSAYGKLQDALGQLKSTAQALGEDSLYRGVTVSSPTDAFSATASTDAVPGNFQVDVNQMARSQSLVSHGVANTSDGIGEGGTVTLKLGDGNGNVSATVALDIGPEDSTLTGIRDAINAADIGISASIINDGSSNPYRLTLTSKQTGSQSQISIQASDSAAATGTPLADLLAYDSQTASGAMTETVAAANAELSINGIDIVRQSNVVEGAIQGVTLTLADVTSGPATLQASRDTGAISDALEAFVSAYNSLHATESKLTAYNGPDADNGILLGDSSARSVDNRLRRALNTPVDGGAYFGLAQIGIAIQRDGTMAIDSGKLEQVLATDPGAVRTLLAGSDTTNGLAAILTGTLDELTGDTGVLATASDGLETSIDNVDERIADMKEHISATMARYRTQFTQLDSLMAQLNSTQSYLSQQFDALSNDSS